MQVEGQRKSSLAIFLESHWKINASVWWHGANEKMLKAFWPVKKNNWVPQTVSSTASLSS